MARDPVVDALATLRSKRDELTAQISRYDEAIRTLSELVDGAVTPTGPTPGASFVATSISPESNTGKSVRVMMLDLMHEDRDRDWSVNEILDEYQRRGTPVHGKDPNNALRAAIADAHKAGTIVRTTTGRYKLYDPFQMATGEEEDAIVLDD